MAEEMENRINLASLQRIDSHITAIVDNASQVALYIYLPSVQEWEKTEIGGTFFVYRRSVDPHYGFIIINRMNTLNLIEPITEDLQYQDSNPFLMYRNNKGSIYCVWFYAEDNCARISKLFNNLCKMATKAKIPSTLKIPKKLEVLEKHGAQTTDIMSLLTRAQNEYDMRVGSNKEISLKVSENMTSVHKNGDIVKPTPVRANGVVHVVSSLPLTVHNLFAQVEDSTHDVACDIPFRTRSTSMVNCDKLASNPTMENAEVILQRLLSNPANTVEHIEKRQKDESFKKLQRTRSATCPKGGAPDIFASVEILEKDLKEKLNILPKSSIEDKMQDSKENLCHSPNNSKNKPLMHTGDFADLPLLTPAMLESPAALSVKYPTENLVKNGISKAVNDSFPKAPFIPLPGIVNQSSPPLLSPMDFAVSNQSPVSKLVSDQTESSVLSSESTYFSNGLRNCGITPLSKNQLREALNFMLRNDDDFLTKIHQSYVESIHNQMNFKS